MAIKKIEGDESMSKEQAENIKQLTQKYDQLIEGLDKYDKIYSDICQQSIEANRGCFGFLEDDPKLKYGWFLKQMLESALFSLHLVIDGKQDTNGECSKKCLGCSGGHYDNTSKSWSCQMICECK
jgi:hypothetical protein